MTYTIAQGYPTIYEVRQTILQNFNLTAGMQQQSANETIAGGMNKTDERYTHYLVSVCKIK